MPKNIVIDFEKVPKETKFTRLISGGHDLIVEQIPVLVYEFHNPPLPGQQINFFSGLGNTFLSEKQINLFIENYKSWLISERNFRFDPDRIHQFLLQNIFISQKSNELIFSQIIVEGVDVRIASKKSHLNFLVEEKSRLFLSGISFV